jgi:hypothetical protein
MRPTLRATLAAVALAACGVDEEPPSYDRGPPPDGFATEILGAHNAVRAGATPAPDPPLAPLSWSASVAGTAQAWADGCSYRHNPELHALSLGENIAATAPPGSRTAAQIVTELWASEAPFYDLVANTCDAAAPENEAHTCGHYTQLVWRSTTVLGCGVRTCTTGSPFSGFSQWDFWVCDYAPPGNWVGERPY